MKEILILLQILFISSFQIESKEIGDNFLFERIEYEKFNNEKDNLIIVLDGNLKLGIAVSKFLESKTNSLDKTNFELVKISHSNGRNKVKRRRDFIPKYSKNPEANCCQSEFSKFLLTEVLPILKKDEEYESITLIGHSLSGNFVLGLANCLEDEIDNYLAISPSLWVNFDGEIKRLNMIKENSSKKIFLGFGELEYFNKIKSGAKKYIEKTNSLNKESISFNHAEIKRKTHISCIEKSIELGMEILMKK